MGGRPPAPGQRLMLAPHKVKYVNNMLNSMHLLLATESAALLKRAHVDPKIAMEVIGRSSGMSMQIRDRLPQEAPGQCREDMGSLERR